MGDEDYKKEIDNVMNFLKKNKNKYLNKIDLQVYSPKFLQLLENIEEPQHIGLHLIYSQFRSMEGIGIFTLVLEANGFSRFKIKKDRLGLWQLDMDENNIGLPCYALYTGTEDDEEREIIRNIYNGDWNNVPNSITQVLRTKNENNNNGEIIKVLMITAAGSEGINLRNTRYVHIIEPYWHPVRLEQVVGRARRICSHQSLPKELQTVEVFLYLSVLTPEQINSDYALELRLKDVSRISNLLQTSDEKLFEISNIKENLTSQLLRAVKESSIDCATYSKASMKEGLVCLSFGETNSNLFSYNPNYTKDENDIIAYQNKVVIEWEAQKIRLPNGKEYAYRADTKQIYDLESYIQAKKIPGLRPLLIGELIIEGKKSYIKKVQFDEREKPQIIQKQPKLTRKQEQEVIEKTEKQTTRKKKTPPKTKAQLILKPQEQEQEQKQEQIIPIVTEITTKNYKVAFLFLTINDVNFPNIWTNYFRQKQDKISIYCHPKNPENVNTSWLRENIIPNIVDTKWGFITNAYFTLFHEALKDPMNQKFVVISESCLPLKTFDNFYNFLNNDNIKTSYIKFMRISKYDQKERLENQPNYNIINEKLNGFIKHYARFCLSRYHVNKIFNLNDIPQDNIYQHNEYIDFFNNMHVGDEFFLSILKPKPNQDFIRNYEITYDNWEITRKEYNRLKTKYYELVDTMEEKLSKIENEKEKSKLKKEIKNEIKEVKAKLKVVANNPYSYVDVKESDIRNALTKESFFWRKFPKDSNIEEFYNDNGIPFI